MKKKKTSENDIVECVVEEAFVKEKYKHCTQIGMGLDMLAPKVVIAENAFEVVTLGDQRKPCKNKNLS